MYYLEIERYHNCAVHRVGILAHNGKQGEGASHDVVTVYGTITTAHYEISILGAADTTALLNWFHENDYPINPVARDVLDSYIDQKWAFVAVKLIPSEKRQYRNEFLPPLTIQYKHDQLIFPLRISSISTAQTAKITLYVIAESTVTSSNFPTANLEYEYHLDETVDAENYIESCINKTLGGYGGRGVVVMKSRELYRSFYRGSSLNKLMRIPFWRRQRLCLTRLDTRMSPEGMTDDINLLLDSSPKTFGVKITAGAGWIESFRFRDGVGRAAGFDQPCGVVTDGTNLYVADSNNNTIRQVEIATGAVTTIAGSPGMEGATDGTGDAVRFYKPYGLATHGTDLYITDSHNHTIRKLEIATGKVTTIAGSPEKRAHADGAGSAARFRSPMGITTDGTNLYVADTGNRTIRKVVISTGEVTTIAGTPGQKAHADGKGSAARFWYPIGTTTDGTNLYVVDQDDHTIRKVVISTGEVTTIAGGPGQQGYVDGTGSAARFHFCRGITTDGVNLYVVDDQTIRKIVIATGAVTTIAGKAGKYGYLDGTGSDTRFNDPNGVATDGTNLYVSDSDNNTIRKVVIATSTVSTIAGSNRR